MCIPDATDEHRPRSVGGTVAHMVRPPTFPKGAPMTDRAAPGRGAPDDLSSIPITKDQLLDWYRQMALIRRVDAV